ncbi:MAG: S24/S26 family peptidase [Acidobacteriota bacterium]
MTDAGNTAAASRAVARRAAVLDLVASSVAHRRTLELRLASDCMAPLLRSGDRLRVVPFARAPTPGDLVLAIDSASALVCHRVIDHEGEIYLLAGDRSTRPERHPRASLLGHVVAAERGGRVLNLDAPAWLARWLARRNRARLSSLDGWASGKGAATGRAPEGLRLIVLHLLAAGWLDAPSVVRRRLPTFRRRSRRGVDRGVPASATAEKSR